MVICQHCQHLDNGELAEWPIASVLKTEVPAWGPWVRILHSPLEAIMKRFVVELTIDTDDDKTWEDVEWSIQDLFYDDDDGNPNYTTGCISGIMAREIKSDPSKDIQKDNW